jgi:hypothetical protein
MKHKHLRFKKKLDKLLTFNNIDFKGFFFPPFFVILITWQEMNKISEIHLKKKNLKNSKCLSNNEEIYRGGGGETIIFRVLIIYGSKCPPQHISV